MRKESSGLRPSIYQFLSVNMWGRLPSQAQKNISRFLTGVYRMPMSRHLIGPYCRLHFEDSDYAERFRPPEGEKRYRSFQDFFTRRFKNEPIANGSEVWPCEGLLCDYGLLRDINTSRVKGEARPVPSIFGVDESVIPKDYYFSNVFLHNKNYHRIHSPVRGRIERIQRIPGDLVILRPWIYRSNPSLPAFRNERVNFDIRDEKGRLWFLSVIGGPGVGTIKVGEGITVGTKIRAVEELSLFLIGSTCCMASPIASRTKNLNDSVEVGESF